MRRLVLEVFEKELTKVGLELPQFQKIKSLEFLYFLRQDHEEFAAVAQVAFKDLTSKVEDLLLDGFLVEAQTLEKNKNGVYTVFMRGGPSLSSVLSFVSVESGYLFPPLGIGEGKIKFSYLGNEAQVKNFLEKINAIGIRYRVVLLSDASFSPISPLSQLTEKQREVLLAAYKLGYYDIPRKITSQELAERLCLVDSTVVEHLRKAEQRLMTRLLEQ
jgi:hypothetical protein